MHTPHSHRVLLVCCLFLFIAFSGAAQIVPVGQGSYTTTFPGTDPAGRNGYPAGTPYLTGAAVNRPVPTNDWWSSKLNSNHVSNLFTYPFTLKTVNGGLVVTYIPWGPIDDASPIQVGVAGLNASAANVADFSDWTVTLDWRNADHNFRATAGIGMPFLYFTKGGEDVAEVTVNQGSATVAGEILMVADARNGADFAVYAPAGSSWVQNGNTYSSTLNGEQYWSMAFLPTGTTDVRSAAEAYQAYAYVFPTDTRAEYAYDEATSVVTTEFVVETEVHEGTNADLLLGLLPHQWANLATQPSSLGAYTYPTVRGTLKTVAANTFTTRYTFHGILPTLPYLDNYSDGFSPAKLHTKIDQVENDGLSTWTDSYNEGQSMNRLIQTARVADLTGDTTARNKIQKTVKARLEDWLSAEENEVAFLFYYNSTWTSLLGYPAGHGQDNNLNDHHFHWGYFIHAAAFVEQFEPGWAAEWGSMIDLLVRDASSPDRNDDLFPYLRNFSPYAGHSWANGFATFPQGNDQESTSESMQFHSSLIHWGSITGNDAIRDMGIYLYTTEQAAVEEYWFDQSNRNFAPNHPYSLVSRVWGNSYDNGTFWTGDIAASYGIELYPIHGGSLYLGHDTTYLRQLWDEITRNTGILRNEPNVNLWHDVMWKYLAFLDPEKAIALYDSYPDRSLKFGVSDAQTYHWLHSMNVLGHVDVSLTADHALAAAFRKEGSVTYVAQNYGTTDLAVTFSDGYVLQVPARTLATSRDLLLTGSLSASFPAAYPGGSVDLTATVTGGTATRVEFYRDDERIGEATSAPYSFRPEDLTVGRHNFYARVYDGAAFSVTNTVTVTVGEQLPYTGVPFAIPGSFASAHYDLFEGGSGNEITYQDVSPGNHGNFRLNESVDAETTTAEGDVVGWIDGGEWLEYTVEVQQAGSYDLSFRFASGNAAGGGPFRIESDGQTVAADIAVGPTGGWSNWSTATVTGIPLKSGKQVMRLHFESGEFNLGRLTFTYAGPLDYVAPVADAGANRIVVLPEVTTTLDGTGSQSGDNGDLSYQWTQVYGPSVLDFSDPTDRQPTLSTLRAGVYLIRLTVTDGRYSDSDEVFVISANTDNVAPKVALTGPAHGSTFIEGETITLTALASDLNDSIQSVSFYVGTTLVGTATQPPYAADWVPQPGTYTVFATAADHRGAVTTSNSSSVTVDPAPPCSGSSWNGDFGYEFSEADDNPTLTFLPSRTGMGTPTTILYYGTDPGNMPGYRVKPNEPFRLSAARGSRIYFYYTYSHPDGGERNNAAHMNTYLTGSCQTVAVSAGRQPIRLHYYPNPVGSGTVSVDLPTGENELTLYDLNGRLLHRANAAGGVYRYDMSRHPAGTYLMSVVNAGRVAVLKVVR